MRTVVFICAFLAATEGAAAQAPGDLFGVFKTFCFDTGMRRDAIQSAVASAGGTVDSDSALGVIWRYDTSLDKHFLVASMNLGTEQEPRTNCIAEIWGHDNAGVNAIRKWIGVPAAMNDSDADKSERYFFQVVGSAHMAIVGAAAFEAAITERRCWYVSLERNTTSDKVYLFDCGDRSDRHTGKPAEH